jgi:hypothetical protein
VNSKHAIECPLFAELATTGRFKNEVARYEPAYRLIGCVVEVMYKGERIHPIRTM